MIKLSIRAAPHNKLMKSAVMAAVILSSAGALLGQTTTNVSFTVNQNVPQGDPSGLANTQTLNFNTVPNFSSIVNLTVTLDISGGLNGGYYAYLVNNTGGFAILLNRPGTTAGNSLGYADSGFNITLSDTGSDIHTYQTVSNPNGGVLTGTWAPDGRNVDPATVVDTDARTSLLSSFAGKDPSGQWTLFLANLDYGEQGELVSWGLSITAVPEPSSVGLALLGLGIFLGVRRLVRRRE
jgi:subtilisin-like proprotein convertase family protein